jgi:hypothetical protein
MLQSTAMKGLGGCYLSVLRRVNTMVYTMVPSWSGGFCEGPLLTRESGGFCWSGGFYELILRTVGFYRQ